MNIYIDDQSVFENAPWSILYPKKFCITNKKSDATVLAVGFRRCITDEYMLQFPNVRFVLSPSTGLDHIKFTNNSIQIISLDPDKIGHIRASSEFAFLLIIASLRKFSLLINGDIKLGNDMYDKVLGILGMGRIGKNVKKYAEAFGARVLWHDLTDGVSKDDVLSLSDIILVSVTCNEDNRDYISSQEFSIMHKQPYFINITREFVVNEDALYEALCSEKIKGAASDVIKDSSRFKSYIDNGQMIITNHVAGTTVESRFFALEYVVKELRMHNENKT